MEQTNPDIGNKHIAIKQAYKGIPLFVRSFLLKALFLFIIWKLLYQLVLFPARVPDKQLTQITAGATAMLYTNLLSNVNIDFKEEAINNSHRTIVFVDDKKIIGIADGCNGLELYVLYIGFLFCIPERFIKQSIYALGGIIIIFILNSFRCFGLVWLFLHHYSFADFAHHYLFKMIIYALIFLIWVKFSKKYFAHAA